MKFLALSFGKEKDGKKKGLVVVTGVVDGVDRGDVLHVQEGVVGHPEGWRGVEADDFSLDVPETLAGGEKGLVTS